MEKETMIGIASIALPLLVALIGFVLQLSYQMGREVAKREALRGELKSLEERMSAVKDAAVAKHCEDVEELRGKIAEDKRHNDTRIAELFESRNALTTSVTKIEAAVQYMVDSMREIKDSIKEATR